MNSDHTHVQRLNFTGSQSFKEVLLSFGGKINDQVGTTTTLREKPTGNQTRDKPSQ